MAWYDRYVLDACFEPGRLNSDLVLLWSEFQMKVTVRVGISRAAFATAVGRHDMRIGNNRSHWVCNVAHHAGELAREITVHTVHTVAVPASASRSHSPGTNDGYPGRYLGVALQAVKLCAFVRLRRRHGSLRQRDDRTSGIQRTRQLLNERLRRSGHERQLHIGPVFSHSVVHDGPALEHRLGVRFIR